MVLDDLNKQILRHLQQGRKSFRKIAETLEVSENTVKARVKKMETEGLLTIAGYINPDEVPGSEVIIIAMKLKEMNYTRKGEEIRRLNRVVSVAVVTGRYDLIATVYLDQEFNLLDFLSRELDKVPGIESIETFVVYKNYDLRLPYLVGENDE